VFLWVQVSCLHVCGHWQYLAHTMESESDLMYIPLCFPTRNGKKKGKKRIIICSIYYFSYFCSISSRKELDAICGGIFVPRCLSSLPLCTVDTLELWFFRCWSQYYLVQTCQFELWGCPPLWLNVGESMICNMGQVYKRIINGLHKFGASST